MILSTSPRVTTAQISMAQGAGISLSIEWSDKNRLTIFDISNGAVSIRADLTYDELTQLMEALSLRFSELMK